MIEISLIRDIVAIFGVLAGFTYYVLTVRNINRARRKDILIPERAQPWWRTPREDDYARMSFKHWEKHRA